MRLIVFTKAKKETAPSSRPPKGWWERVTAALGGEKGVKSVRRLAGWIWYHGIKTGKGRQERRKAEGKTYRWREGEKKKGTRKSLAAVFSPSAMRKSRVGEEDFGKKFAALVKKGDLSDETFHAWAKRQGWDEHRAEEAAYRMLASFLGGGLARKKGFTEKDADPKELRLGVKVEMEHTNSRWIAKRIALDHLAENPRYYSEVLLPAEKRAGSAH